MERRVRIQIKEERDTRGRQEEEEGAMYFEVMSRAKTCLPRGTPGGGGGFEPAIVKSGRLEERKR